MTEDFDHELEFDAPADDYWSNARRPFTCLIFLAPVLFAYELGVAWLGGESPESLRNGADHWMRGWLDGIGLGQPWLLPAMVIVALLGWQIWGKFPWKFSPDTLVGMFAESLLFAFGLVALGQLQDLLFQHVRSMGKTLDVTAPAADSWSRLVTFLGAGVYEEVLFRLCLIPLCYLGFRILLLPKKWAVGASIVATSLIFAGAHYVGPAADPFDWYSFTFRGGAGFFFAMLFVMRGFGITVGCHAAYDVLVGILMQHHTA